MTGPGPWREPAEESTGLYPGLVVDDGRVTGSITVGRSRLPLWAFVGMAVVDGWDEVEADYTPSEHGLSARDLAIFLYNLLGARGEFGRLLLALANAERAEGERQDQGAPSPPWWDDSDLSAPVADQLRRCLAVIEDDR